MKKFLVLIACLPALESFALDRKFPPGKVINVKEHGVMGNGSTQDWTAIQTLISTYVGQNRYLYFPNGTYRINNTLIWAKANGTKDCGLTLIGESMTGTTLKLDDELPAFSGFGGGEKPMLQLFSQTNSAGQMNETPPNPPNPYWDHAKNNGLGNSAFRNAVMNMTIDVGAFNPGAVGIDFMANNIGRIQDVIVKSTDPLRRGRAGIALDRGNPGPHLVKNVSIIGFDYGMRVNGKIASITMEKVQLFNQKILGIQNFQNSLFIRKLTSTNSVPVIENKKGGGGSYPYEGYITLIDCQFTGGSSSAAAIENEGSMFVRNLTTSGYSHAIKNRGELVPGSSHGEYTAVWNSYHVSNQSAFSLFASPPTSLGLPVLETPEYFDLNFSNWAVVDSNPAAGAEECEAIHAAFNANKSTVFFTNGTFTCAETFDIPAHVKHILGDGAVLGVHDVRQVQRPFFHFAYSNHDLLIENLDFNENAYPGDPPAQGSNPGLTHIQHTSGKALTLSGVRFWGRHDAAKAYRAMGGAGNLFIEDVAAHETTQWTLAPGQFAWARQFNPEGMGPKIVNNGATLWILGLKTENPGTVGITSSGGKTELLGGLLVPVNEVASGDPAFIIDNASASLSFAFNNPMIAGNQHAWYDIQVREIKNGVTRELTVNQVTANTSTRDSHLPLYVSKNGWSDPMEIRSIEANLDKPPTSPLHYLRFTMAQGALSPTAILGSTSKKSLVASHRTLLKAFKSGKKIRVNSTHGYEANSILVCKDAADCPKPEN